MWSNLKPARHGPFLCPADILPLFIAPQPHPLLLYFFPVSSPWSQTGPCHSVTSVSFSATQGRLQSKRQLVFDHELLSNVTPLAWYLRFFASAAFGVMPVQLPVCNTRLTSLKRKLGFGHELLLYVVGVSYDWIKLVLYHITQDVLA